MLRYTHNVGPSSFTNSVCLQVRFLSALLTFLSVPCQLSPGIMINIFKHGANFHVTWVKNVFNLWMVLLSPQLGLGLEIWTSLWRLLGASPRMSTPVPSIF